jgi:hypothetical protein
MFDAVGCDSFEPSVAEVRILAMGLPHAVKPTAARAAVLLPRTFLTAHPSPLLVRAKLRRGAE